jgi:hypothetical protein
MPHVSERRPQDDDRDQDRPEGPREKPSGELGGHPINADETVPSEVAPDPDEGGSGQPRHPDAVDDAPGSDL